MRESFSFAYLVPLIILGAFIGSYLANSGSSSVDVDLAGFSRVVVPVVVEYGPALAGLLLSAAMTIFVFGLLRSYLRARSEDSE